MRHGTRQRGSVLVVAMWVIIALTGLVLTLSFSMRTEAKAGANRLSQAQAEMAEHGAEQFLLSVVDQEIATPGTMANISFEARQIGDCYFWVVRPDWDNETSPGQAPLGYGLVDEGGKIDLNTAGVNMLNALPGMTADVADCILDWRSDPTGSPRAQGAKDDYYLSLPDPYHCKGAPYESLEELLLVKGMTRDILYGYDRNRNGVMDPQELQSGDPGMMFNSQNQGAVGFAPYVTIYGVKAGKFPSSTTTSGTTTTTPAPANINSTDTTRLRNVLTQALSSSRATELVTATARELRAGPFTSVFDYYYKMGMTPDEFTKVYPVITDGPSTGAPGAPGSTTRPATTATPALGKVNINTAPQEVLSCLVANGQPLDPSDVQAILSHRSSLTSPTAADLTNLAWLVNVGLTQDKVRGIGTRVMGRSSVYSADVVAVSGDGRAFRRYRIVIDGSVSPAVIISRDDLTLAGWPLPQEIRDMIRAGEGPGVPVMTSGQGGPLK